MTIVGWLQIIIVLALVLAAAIPLSSYIARVLAGERTFLSPVLVPVEKGFYKLSGVDPAQEQSWITYTMAMLAFSVVGFITLYLIQRLQNFLPLNPQGFDPVNPDLAFNTSMSFVTNTNWQNYGGETTMSHLVQMLGLTVHNFVSAATGLAMAWALVRAFARSEAKTLGNFWADLTRVVLHVLLPISIVGAVALILCGVPQTLAPWADATTLEGAKQTISLGPVASQEIIKELGTNGGGFFNVNSAHPFENPNVWSDIVEIFAILLVPVASVLAFGRAIGDLRQGRAILITMGILLIVSIVVVYWFEAHGNPLLTALGVDPSQGNMEGKEVRIGIPFSSLFTAATSGTSTGAVNAMFDSFTPLAGLVPMFNLLAGCIWPGGVGAGLYGFLVVVVIAVFVAGLMVGRTPEYLGKKIEIREMKFAMLAVLIYPLSVLGFTAASVLLPTALASLNNSGPHGLSEILYAFASQNANNGSAFAGLTGNTLWFNSTGGLVMFLGRFLYVVPVLAMAGSLAAKKKVPASAGTFPTHGGLFVGLLIGVVVILYLLQYFPALALGPVVEHYLMLAGKAF
jgi:K+-transporting ATPase ATPase A chain